jgi:hypothetical protein
MATALSAVLVFGGCATSDEQIVLGSRHVVQHGVGWGTAEPREVFNGGVPNGKAWNIRWSNWGGAIARGHGLTWIYTPHDGYYRKPAVIELRAHAIGRCSPKGPRVYLISRRAKRPARGSLGSWFQWGGWPDGCTLASQTSASSSWMGAGAVGRLSKRRRGAGAQSPAGAGEGSRSNCS